MTKSKCPECGTEHETSIAAGVGRELDRGRVVGPRPGDVAVCAECLSFVELDEQLQLRRPSRDRLRALQADPVMERTRLAAAMARMLHGRGGGPPVAVVPVIYRDARASSTEKRARAAYLEGFLRGRRERGKA